MRVIAKFPSQTLAAKAERNRQAEDSKNLRKVGRYIDSVVVDRALAEFHRAAQNTFSQRVMRSTKNLMFATAHALNQVCFWGFIGVSAFVGTTIYNVDTLDLNDKQAFTARLAASASLGINVARAFQTSPDVAQAAGIITGGIGLSMLSIYEMTTFAAQQGRAAVTETENPPEQIPPLERAPVWPMPRIAPLPQPYDIIPLDPPEPTPQPPRQWRKASITFRSIAG